jgi:GntR family transcriptional regulator
VTTSIAFRLDPGSGLPTYLQLALQVRRAIRLGRLRPGDQLPSVREAVATLAINPNTVVKAYRELETAGLVISRPGTGTFVRKDLRSLPPGAHTGLRRELARWLARARAAGLDDEDVRALLEDLLREAVAPAEASS